MTNFIRRTVTGAFIVVLVLGGIWLHPFSFFLVGVVMIAGMQREYYIMVRATGVSPQITGGIGAGVLLYIISTLTAADLISIKWLPVMVPVTAAVMVAELFRKEKRPFDSLAHTLFPLLYIALPISLFPFAAFNRAGISALLPVEGVLFTPGMVIGFFLLLWTSDTGAYLIGSVLGRHPLFKRISPKKTWEGFTGGMVLTLAVAWFLSGWLGVTGRGGWLIMAVIISAGGMLGDLLESLLKRSLGVKDSGKIMPGHGGFLDRFDSVVTAFPLAYIYFLIVV